MTTQSSTTTRVSCALFASAFAMSACVPVDVASHPRDVQPERPTVATHAGTVAPGYVEVETGVEHDRIDANTHADQVPTVIKFGVAPRVQFSLSVPMSSGTGVSFGVGDIATGLKITVLKDHPILSDFAILPQIKFSTGGARGTGTTDASLLLINSRSIGSVDVDLNVGVTRRSGDGIAVPRTATLFAASAGIPLRGKLSFALECFGYPGTGGPAGSPPTVAMLFGPTYLVEPELNLDLGWIAPISGGQPRALYVGLVANLGRLPLPVRGTSKR
ncbi:MAG: transporter [Gemmatimonadaceae bacterium]